MGITHLHNTGAIVFVLILAACITLGQFNHKKPWPTYSLQNMPQTGFTCHDKILGGYYADPEAQCQMFHVCVKVAGVGVQDFRFLCPNGTAFDQEVQICANWGDVDCEEAVLYYGSDNFDLYRLGSGFESKRAPLAEEEESTFHLQRAETADIRRSKETQVDQKLRPESLAYTKKYDSTTRNSFYERNSDNRKSNYDQNNDFNRVTSKSEHLKKTTSSYYTTPRGNDINNNADSKQDVDDLFKGSHSSNFFSNRNGGREDDFYDNKPSGSTTTSTTRPQNPPNQFYNGNGAQNDYNDFNKIPNDTTKRPHRSRRPIQNNPTSSSSIPTSPPSTTFATTKRLTLQTSYNAPQFNSNNSQSYRPTSPSYSTPPTQRTTPKFAFGTNDLQQNIQPTTYNPTGAFRYKATTSKYDDISETALRGERPGQSTLLNSQYESQNFDVFNKVSNRKASNSERNFEKQQSKNSTFANRNEFTDYTKTKTPSGFQTSSPRSSQAQNNIPQGPINLNVQPLDPSKLNSELRHFNQTQQNNRGRAPNSRFSEQTEPQYFRSRTLETPAPFAVPQSQQQSKPQFDNNPNGSPQQDFNRIKTDSNAPNVEPLSKPYQQHASKTFDGRANGYLPLQNTKKPTQDQKSSDFSGLSPPRKEATKVRDGNDQNTGTGVDRDFSPRLQSKPHQTNFNGNQNSQTGRLRTDKVDSYASPQVPNPIEVNLNGYNSPQLEVNRIRPRSRIGSTSNKNVTSNSFQQADSSSTTAQQAEPTPKRGRGRINYKATTLQQNRFTDNFVQSTTSGLKKFSTLVPKDQYYPTTFKPTTYKKAFEQKPSKHVDPKQRGTPYTTTTTPLPSSIFQPSNAPDEDDGQYHPELYEVDDSQNYDLPSKKPAVKSQPHSAPSPIISTQQRPQPSPNTQTTRSPQAHLQTQQQTAFNKQSHQTSNNYQPLLKEKQPSAIPTDLSDEEELFKTAHSLNLGAASINKLRADTLKTPDKTPQQSSPNFGFDRTTYSTTITTTPLTTTWRPTTSFIASSTTSTRTSPSKKPKKSSASKRPPHADADTSYDYAYYDSLSETPQEYSEYDVISEFRKTKKY